MNSLPDEMIAKIFSYCELDDRLILESVNNRIRSCITRYAYADTTILDVPYLETVTRRPITPKQRPIRFSTTTMTFLSSSSTPTTNGEEEEEDDEIKTTTRTVEEEYVRFVLSLFEAVIPKFGNNRHFRGVRLSDDASMSTLTIEKEILLSLYEHAPNLTSLDFGRRPVRLDALKGCPFPYYNGKLKQNVDPMMRSVGVLDVFIRFVLSGSCGDGLKKLDLECPDGSRVWSSVIQYAERFAGACPLETLRISWFPNPCSEETLPIPLPLPDLASVTWPRLRELRVDYSNFNMAPIWVKNLRAVRSGINTSSPAARFGGRVLARAFPRLRVFSWPYMRDSETVYEAVLKCQYLRRIIISVNREPVDLSRYGTISHRRLERIDLVRLRRYDSPTIRDLSKTYKSEMFEKMRILRDVDGLRESELMVVERNGYK